MVVGDDVTAIHVSGTRQGPFSIAILTERISCLGLPGPWMSSDGPAPPVLSWPRHYSEHRKRCLCGRRVVGCRMGLRRAVRNPSPLEAQRRKDAGLRIAVLTHGYTVGGGVPAVTTWLASGLLSMGHTVEVHDLSTSSSDPFSRRLRAPRSWLTSPHGVHVQATSSYLEHWHWGSHFRVEPSLSTATGADATDALVRCCPGCSWRAVLGKCGGPDARSLACFRLQRRRAGSVPLARRL